MRPHRHKSQSLVLHVLDPGKDHTVTITSVQQVPFKDEAPWLQFIPGTIWKGEHLTEDTTVQDSMSMAMATATFTRLVAA